MITVLTIEGRRDTYSASDCAKNTITVGELISVLERYDYDLPVIIDNDNGYTYGEIHESTIEESDVVDDDEYEEDEEEEDE